MPQLGARAAQAVRVGAGVLACRRRHGPGIGARLSGAEWAEGPAGGRLRLRGTALENLSWGASGLSGPPARHVPNLTARNEARGASPLSTSLCIHCFSSPHGATGCRKLDFAMPLRPLFLATMLLRLGCCSGGSEACLFSVRHPPCCGRAPSGVSACLSISAGSNLSAMSAFSVAGTRALAETCPDNARGFSS